MNCFYHPSVVAVGICKSCGKGLCAESAVDIDGKGLACKGRCEEDVKFITRLINRNVVRSPLKEQALKTADKNRNVNAIFNIVFGLLFLTFTAYQCFAAEFSSFDVLFAGVGILFLFLGLFRLQQARRMKAPAK